MLSSKEPARIDVTGMQYCAQHSYFEKQRRSTFAREFERIRSGAKQQINFGSSKLRPNQQ
jgi:hypothetical protein